MIDRARPASSRRGKTLARAAALLAGAAVVFAVGVALGQALRDQPAGGERTEVRTLRPLTVAPTPKTVTVTVTVEAEG